MNPPGGQARLPKLRAELGRGRGEERGTFTRVHTEAQGRSDVWNIPENGCFVCCGMEAGGGVGVRLRQ